MALVYPLVNSGGQWEYPIDHTTDSVVSKGFYVQKAATALNSPTSTSGIEYNQNPTVDTYLVVKTEGTKISFQVAGNEYASVDNAGVFNAASIKANSFSLYNAGTTNYPFVMGSSWYKTKFNLASYSLASTPTSGAFVIETNVPFATAYDMFTVELEGHAYAVASPYFRIVLGGYAYPSGTFIGAGYETTSRYRFSQIRFARNITTGNVVFILGDIAESFSYLRLEVAKVSGTAAEHAVTTAWSITQQTSLANYDKVTTASDYTSTDRLFSSATDSSTAIAALVNTSTTWANTSSKLLSLRNNNVEKIYAAGYGTTTFIRLNDGTRDMSLGTDANSPWLVSISNNDFRFGTNNVTRWRIQAAGHLVAEAAYNINTTGGSVTALQAVLTNGDGSASYTKPQVSFGFAGNPQYQHYIHTRHNASAATNAFDFYVSDGVMAGVFPTNAVLVATMDYLGLTLPGALVASSASVGGFGILAGFENRTTSTISFVDGTRVLTITPTGSFVIWANNVKYTKSTLQTVTIANTVGEHFVYYNASGALVESTTPWNVESDQIATVATVYWDGTKGVIGDERHGAFRNRTQHAYLHNTRGTAYQSGLAGTFTNTTLSVLSGIIWDEDIKLDLSSTYTTCRLWYRTTGGTVMTSNVASATPYAVNAGALQYDLNGVLTNASNNNYIVNWVFATNDKDYPVAVVVGQTQNATLIGARNAAQPTFPNITTREWKLLYSVMYRNAAGTPTFIESVDYRNASSLPNATVTSLPAISVTFTPAGAIASVNVQAALEELDLEKAALAGPTFTGVPAAPTAAYNTSTTQLATTAFVAQSFGAYATSGTLDWNHASNSKPGSGYSLLLGTDTNGPGTVGNYFHPFTFEYGTKDGSGNLTQFAIPYGNLTNELWMRGRYSSTWGSWVKIWTSSSLTNANLPGGPYLPLTGGALTGGVSITTAASTLAIDVPNGANLASGYNYFLKANNDLGNAVQMFINGSTRAGDGGPGVFTVRNDMGGIRLMGGVSGASPVDLTGSSVRINTVAYDANTAVAAVVQGALLTIGDSVSAATLTNGVGIKFHDAGISHGSLKWAPSLDSFQFARSSSSGFLTFDAAGSALDINVGTGTVSLPRTTSKLSIATSTGADAISLVTGARLHLGSGTTDYLYSNGTTGTVVAGVLIVDAAARPVVLDGTTIAGYSGMWSTGAARTVSNYTIIATDTVTAINNPDTTTGKIGFRFGNSEKLSLDKDGHITWPLGTTYYGTANGHYFGNGNLYSNYGGLYLGFGSGTGGVITTEVGDGASAIALTLNNSALAIAGAKLLSSKNNNVEKFFLDKDGLGAFRGGINVYNTTNIGFAWSGDTTLATGYIGWWNSSNLHTKVGQTASGSLSMVGGGAATASYIATILGSTFDQSIQGAKLLSIQNGAVERLYVDGAGYLARIYGGLGPVLRGDNTAAGVTVTNLCLQSQSFDSGTWTKVGNTAVAPTISGTNTIVAPDGTTTAEVITYPAVSAGWSAVGQTVAGLTAATGYCFSVYLKAAVAGPTYLYVYSGGFIGTQLVNLTTEWQRLHLNFTANATSATIYMGCDVTSAGTTMTAKSAITVHAWGAQVEAGATPTPYIATTTVAIGTTLNQVVTIDSLNSISTGKMLSVRNLGIERLYVDRDGTLVASANLVSTGGGILLNNTGAVQNYIQSAVADGPTAVGVVINTTTNLVDGSAKLMSWRRQGSEVAYIGADGTFGNSLGARIYGVNGAAYFPGSVQTGGAFAGPSNAGITLQGYAANASNAIGATINNTVSLLLDGALLLSVKNNGTEKFYVNKDGGIKAPTILIDRQNNVTNGINWYNGATYTTWFEYMGPAATANQGPKGNLTPPTGSFVTGWALRSLVQNTGGFGWVWESGVDGGTTPGLVAELSSSTGNFRTIGSYTSALTSGNAFTAGSTASGATATPVSIALGGSYSSTAGANLKLRLYGDASPANDFGLGISVNQMDYVVPTGSTHNWYVGTTKRATVSATGLSLSLDGYTHAIGTNGVSGLQFMSAAATSAASYAFTFDTVNSIYPGKLFQVKHQGTEVFSIETSGQVFSSGQAVLTTGSSPTFSGLTVSGAAYFTNNIYGPTSFTNTNTAGSRNFIQLSSYVAPVAGDRWITFHDLATGGRSPFAWFDHAGDYWIEGVQVTRVPGTAAGSDTFVQYNNAGSFGGEAGFEYNAQGLHTPKLNVTRDNVPGGGGPSTALNLRAYGNDNSTIPHNTTAGVVGDGVMIDFYANDNAGGEFAVGYVAGVVSDPDSGGAAGGIHLIAPNGYLGDAYLRLKGSGDSVLKSNGDINLWAGYVEIGPDNASTGTPGWQPILSFRGFNSTGDSDSMSEIHCVWRDGTGADSGSSGLNINANAGIDLGNVAGGGFISTPYFYSGSAGFGNTQGALRLSTQARPGLAAPVAGAAGDGIQIKAQFTDTAGTENSDTVIAMRLLDATPSATKTQIVLAVADGIGGGASAEGGPRLMVERNAVMFDDGTRTHDLLHGTPSQLLEMTPANAHSYANNYNGDGTLNWETWTTTAGSLLARRKDYTYTTGRVATEITKVYSPTDGTTIVAQTTITYSYTSGKLSSYACVRNV